MNLKQAVLVIVVLILVAGLNAALKPSFYGFAERSAGQASTGLFLVSLLLPFFVVICAAYWQSAKGSSFKQIILAGFVFGAIWLAAFWVFSAGFLDFAFVLNLLVTGLFGIIIALIGRGIYKILHKQASASVEKK